MLSTFGRVFGKREVRRPGTVMALAALVFLGLGVAQLWFAYRFGRFALTTDGLHNLGDALLMELMRRSLNHPGTRLGRWACVIRPLMPFLVSVAALLGTVALLVVAIAGSRVSDSSNGVQLSLWLEAGSFAANVSLAWLMPCSHAHNHGRRDSATHALFARVHLEGDSLAALTAMAAYAVILLGGPARLCDIAGGCAGAVLVAWFHRRPAMDSIEDWKQHRLPHVHETEHHHDRR